MAEHALAAARRRLRRPVVIAHRGSSRRAPENSIEALRRARDDGADGVEFDVQRCGSGELVVFHDRTLARCTGHVGAVAETPLSVIRGLTLDRVASARALDVRGARIPTLAEWLAEIPDDFVVNLEVKAESWAGTEFAEDCAHALEGAGLAPRSVVSSFHPIALHRLVAEPVDLGALVDAASGWRGRLAFAMTARVTTIHPEFSLVTAGRVRLWHALGYRVAIWTVDAPDEAMRLLDAGVDAVITNRPDVVRPIAERFLA